MGFKSDLCSPTDVRQSWDQRPEISTDRDFQITIRNYRSATRKIRRKEETSVRVNVVKPARVQQETKG